MSKTIVNTARSKNLNDRKGFSVHVTRTFQRYRKYYTPKNSTFAPTSKMSKEISESGNFKPYIEFLESKKNDAQASGFIKALSTRHDEVTLICFCENPDKCHRTVLARWICETYPDDFILGDLK